MTSGARWTVAAIAALMTTWVVSCVTSVTP